MCEAGLQPVRAFSLASMLLVAHLQNVRLFALQTKQTGWMLMQVPLPWLPITLQGKAGLERVPGASVMF